MDMKNYVTRSVALTSKYCL